MQCTVSAYIFSMWMWTREARHCSVCMLAPCSSYSISMHRETPGRFRLWVLVFSVILRSIPCNEEKGATKNKLDNSRALRSANSFKLFLLIDTDADEQLSTEACWGASSPALSWNITNLLWHMKSKHDLISLHLWKDGGCFSQCPWV